MLTCQTKYKIIIIDDSVMMRIILRRYISTLHEFKVIDFPQNSKKALAVLDPFPDISILILDIEMLEIDGFKFLAQIRAKTTAKIIVLSSLVDTSHADAKENIARAMQLGADAVLSKPSGKVCLNFANQRGEALTNLFKQLVHQGS